MNNKRIGAAVLFQLASLSCSAAIVEDFQYIYYPVDIKENQQYYRATAESSPLELHGKKPIGLHQARYQWQWTTKKHRQSGLCSINSFVIQHKTRIHLPQLTTSVDDKQARQFHYYAELIKDHEHEHYYIAKRFVQQFEQRVMRDMAVATPCDQFSNKIRKIYDELMVDCDRDQDDFDARDAKVSKIKAIHCLLYG
jgi:predicted secreted Zn-dependent protease